MGPLGLVVAVPRLLRQPAEREPERQPEREPVSKPERGHGGAVGPAQVVHGVSVAFLAVGLVLPVLLTPIYFPWMWLARILAFINTHLLLGLVFYTLFTFIGLAMRLCGRDPLDRKLAPDQDSYWQRREQPLLSREHYLRQF